MPQALLGVSLEELPLEKAQLYIEGCVWHHLNEHGYKDAKQHNASAYWLSAHLCSRIFTLMHYIDDQPRREPTIAVRSDRKGWAASLGYTYNYIGNELNRLVAEGFLHEAPEIGKKPKHYIFGPLFPEEVQDLEMFKHGKAARFQINKKIEHKIKDKPKKVVKTPIKVGLEQLIEEFSNKVFAQLKLDYGLFTIAGKWITLADEFKRHALTKEGLEGAITSFHSELADSADEIPTHLLIDIYSLLINLLQEKLKIDNKQQIIQLARNYKEEASCLQ